MYIEKEIEEKVQRLLNTMPRNMSHALGIEFLSLKKDEIKTQMPVDENTIQPFGILHGGASAALAETAASIGAWLNIDETTKAAVGIELNANHIRAVRKGSSVIATARPIHRGGTIQVWETKIHTPDDKLVCVSRCTLAVVDNS
jgi:1,4-dihydroxy-2-naphthoyl-CoA hydrolase